MDEMLTDMTNLKKKRGQPALLDRERWMIVYCYTRVRYNRARDREQRKAKGGRKPKEDSGQEVADLLGVSRSTVNEVIAAWNRCKKSGTYDILDGQGSKRGQHTKHTRIPCTNETLRLVRDFVTDRRTEHTIVTATEVLDMLRKRAIVKVVKDIVTGDDDEKALASAKRATQRFLVRAGYIRGKTGRSDEAARPSTHVLEWLTNYLKVLLDNRKLPPEQQLREVRPAAVRSRSPHHECARTHTHTHTHTRTHAHTHTHTHTR